MRDKLMRFSYNHPYATMTLFCLIIFSIAMISISIWKSCEASNLEDVKDAQYVIYTSGGEMRAVEYSTIVDMENGYQYRIFEIDGQYVCAPAIDADGTVYKTVE